MKSTSPYESLPYSSFWRSGVQGCDPSEMFDIYKRKFIISGADHIATAGSCFAQHIARHMRTTGFSVLDLEVAPPGMSPVHAQHYGYGLYSARYGNVYTSRQLLQLLREADGDFFPKAAVWERNDRFFDALRPSVEPEGLSCPEEVQAHRERHLEMVRRMLKQVTVFIFTLGLTETWVHKDSGTVYPTAPGTIAGQFDPAVFEFKNLSVDEILSDMREVFAILRRYNPQVRVILTVSPVPLTATAASQHVLRASTYSKSVLRVAAETLSAESDAIDYFPSFEIITNPANRSGFFESNLRSVASHGVESVMRVFLNAHNSDDVKTNLSKPAAIVEADRADDLDDDVICEEQLLEAFGRSHK